MTVDIETEQSETHLGHKSDSNNFSDIGGIMQSISLDSMKKDTLPDSMYKQNYVNFNQLAI